MDMGTKPTQGGSPEKKKVHVSDDHGNPTVPSNENTIELVKANGDTVTWLKANAHVPGFEVSFDSDKGSPFASGTFKDGDTSDEIVVEPDAKKVYPYRIQLNRGDVLDPGIIIK